MGLFDSITGVGAIAALEQRFAAHVGVPFAVAMSNGTAALHAALIGAGVRRGDEVIAPAYTWGGTIAGLLQMGGVPVFADIDETATIDPADVERRIGRRTKAVIAVHLFGHPCDTGRLVKLCDRYGLVLIEDCAQALSASIAGRVVGSFGIGCFSFSFGKPLSVGEGGMLTTGDPSVYDRVLYHTQHPLRQIKDIHALTEPNQFAANFRLAPPLAKAVLRRFDTAIESIEQKRAFYGALYSFLLESPITELKPPAVRSGVKHSWHCFSPAIDQAASETSISAIRALFAAHDCDVAPGYIQLPLHRDPALFRLVSRKVARQIKTFELPRSDVACATRVVVRRRSLGRKERRRACR